MDKVVYIMANYIHVLSVTIYIFYNNMQYMYIHAFFFQIILICKRDKKNLKSPKVTKNVMS